MTKRRNKAEVRLARAVALVKSATSLRDHVVDALCDAQYEVNMALEHWGAVNDEVGKIPERLSSNRYSQFHSLKRG